MKLSYRPEIDGLRGISIILVILYHLKISIKNQILFEFGYLGVDIFFVISGYLIGRIVFKKISEKNFNFKSFYESRARRLLPALFFSIFLSLFLAITFLLPIDLIHYAKSILTSIFFTSNFFFFVTDIQYDAKDSLLLPLLHTWSLSVEEQFYLFFPITIFLLIKYFKKLLFFFIILGIILSLLLAEFIDANLSKSLNFFMLPTRIWELLIGTLIAFLEFKKKNLVNRFGKNQIFSFFGFLLILVSFIIFDNSTKHPSFLSLIPMAGTGLILFFQTNQSNQVLKILSSKILVNIGLISYSLYLIHFPILAFFRIYFGDLNLSNIAFITPLIFFVSFLSYKYIEKPFRDKKVVNSKKLVFLFTISFILLISSSFYLINTKGLSFRLPEIFSNESHLRIRDKLQDKNGTCFHRQDAFCNFNNFKKRPKVILVGDSIMGSISYNLKERLDDAKINFKTIMTGACYYIPNFEIPGTSCSMQYQQNMENEILNEKNSIVILGGYLTYYLKNKKFIGAHNQEIDESIKNSITNLLDKNHQVILIYPSPDFNEHVPQKIFNLLKKEIIFKLDKKNIETKLSENIITKDFDEFKSENDEVFKIFDEIKHKNLHKVYPHTLFCNTYVKNKCSANTHQYFFFSDKYHPSKFSSKMINNLIMKKINEIIKR